MATVGYAYLSGHWADRERVARIDQAIEERKARLALEVAYRNKLAEKSLQQAALSENESNARWEAAKERGKLPGNNTVEGGTPANADYRYHQPPISR